MAHRRNFRDEDTKSILNCDTDSDEYVEDTGINYEDYVEEEQPSPPVQWKQIKKSGLRSQTDQTHVHQFTGSDTGKKQNKAPYINKDSSPLSGFMLYFTSVMYVFVTKTNIY
jgi:hypothetical protein